MKRILKRVFVLFLLSAYLPLFAQSLAITESSTDHKYPGKFVWADLLTTDVRKAARFYSDVFGWHATYFDADYLVLSHRGQRLGGIAKNQDEATESNQWISFISSSDLEKSHRYLTNAGAEVVFEPTFIEGRGEIAIYVAPDSAVFGVIDSASGDPVEEGAEIGEWVWIELWSTDTKIAAAFYAELGYEVVDNWMSDRDQDLLLAVGEIARAGLVQGHESQKKSIWLPYVLVESVADTLLKVKKAGGESRELKGEAKPNIVLIADPTGGLLAIYEAPQWEGES
ncbi:MAG: VOC family protein [bacterium]|nr:VOC family protein [Gammaproteobacteria bacterium]HIL96228.1 VOC family protein [Pseudomonadales bacterium]